MPSNVKGLSSVGKDELVPVVAIFVEKIGLVEQTLTVLPEVLLNTFQERIHPVLLYNLEWLIKYCVDCMTAPRWAEVGAPIEPACDGPVGWIHGYIARTTGIL
jgi:hypothetical protein